MSETTTKRTQAAKPRRRVSDDLAKEYRFDYSQAKPNRFAARAKQGSRTVILDPDVAAIFTTAESVNAVLRAMIAVMPKVEAVGKDS